MPTFVELPDKTELEFPDGMDEIAMHREIVKAFPQFAQETPSESAAVSVPGEAMAAGTPRAASLIPEAFPAQTEQLKEMKAAKTPELTGAEVESMLMTPQITIPNVIPKSFPITRGVFETVKGIPEFITAPGAPLITMAQQIPGVREAVDAAMGAGMVKTAALLAGEASVTGDKEQMAQAVSSGLLGSTMLAAPHVSPILANEIAARSVGAPDLVAADLAARRAVSIRDKPALVSSEAAKVLNKSVGEIEKMNVGEEVAPTLAPPENKLALEAKGQLRAIPTPGTAADEFGAVYGPRLSQDAIKFLNEQTGDWVDLPAQGDVNVRAKMAGRRVWVEASKREGAFERRGIATMTVDSDGTTILNFGGDKKLAPIAQQSLTESLFKNKPAPAALEQAPQVEAPAAETVSLAPQASEVAASESLPAISQTTPPSESGQVGIAATGKPEAAVAPLKLPQTPDEWLAEADRLKQERQESKGPGVVGMGGATPEEFTSRQRATADKNAVIDAERIARGEQPMVAPMRRSNQEVFDKAMAELSRNPELPDQLTKEMMEHPRVLLDWEHMAVLRRRVELKYEFEKAERESNQAFEDMEAAKATGNSEAADARSEAMAVARQQADYWFAKLGEHDRAFGMQSEAGVGGAGTEAGRALAIRRTVMNEDFSLASLALRKSAANGHLPLDQIDIQNGRKPGTTRAELVKQADEYKRLNAELEKKLSSVQASEADAQKALADLKAQTQKAPGISEYVLKTAEKWVAQWGKEAEVARKNLAGKFLSPSPADLLDLAKIVRFRIGEVGLDVAKISAELIKDFGEGVKPYIEGAIKTAQEMIDRLGESVPKAIRQQVKDAATKKQPDVESVTGKIAAKLEKGESDNITPQVKKLAEMFWEQGIRELNPMIDALQGVLKKFFPEITRQETMDSLSGRGRFSIPDQAEVKVGIRDLSTQARLVAHQIDVEAGRPLPRTGPQRDPMSDAARREEQRLQELKRKFGVVVTDPTRQLASALQQAKTYLRNRMADLREEIASRERIVKTKTPLQPDAELEAMRKEYEHVKADHEAIFPKRELTDEQRIAAANQALDRAISNLEADLKSGKLFREKKISKTPNTAELQAKRARLEALRDQRQELRDLANPKKSPAERALQSRKTRLTKQIADMQDRLARGDFSKKARPDPLQDPEVISLQYQKNLIQKKFNEGLIEDTMRKRSRTQKVFATGMEAVNAARAIMTSMDLSAVLRQGKMMVLSHPIRASRSIMPMLRAFRSPEKAFAVEQQIMARPNYPLYKKAGLFLSEHGQTLSQMEEAYMSRWAGKVPLVAGSQRAYTTFLNKLRADSFDAMVKTLGKGGNVTPSEAKVIANYVNVSTGRGTPGMNANAAVGLNTVFFAPRYVASRFQMLLGQPMWFGAASGKVPFKGTMRARAVIAGEYARILAGVAVVYGLGMASGAEIETDPRSTDFGKIRFGNTRIDPMAGLIQVTTLLSRLGTGETKTAKGLVVPIRGKLRYGQSDAVDVMARFARTKLAPVPGAITDLASGKDFAGQPVTLGSEVLDLLTPMSLGDVYKSMVEKGIPAGTALGILSIFGESIQTYDANKRAR